MTEIVETAFAKINLALHVRARRADGYHELETVFAFARHGDAIGVGLASELSLSVTGPFGGELTADEDNLVLRAARAMQRHFGVREGAAMVLEKELPVAAGLGGGSADAAAVARALARLWRLDADETALIAAIGALGADVPACVASHTMIGKGVGERLEPFDAGLGGAPILLVNPLLPCATGPVFRAWDGVDRGALDPARPADWRNDLQSPAMELVPQIGEVLAVLEAQPGVTLARMSGSGASCFALGDAAALAGAAHACRARGWWAMETALR